MSRRKHKGNITMYDVVGSSLYKKHMEEIKIKHFAMAKPKANIIWCRVKLEGKDE